MKSDHSGGEEMLLRFTFVPRGSTRRPWRRQHGARRPMTGEHRPMPRWPSPPRAASDRPPWGSGFALDGGRKRWGEIVINVICILCLSFYLSSVWRSFSAGSPNQWWVWSQEAKKLQLGWINRCHCCPLLELLEHYMSWKSNLTYWTLTLPLIPPYVALELE